ncbi:hypothetical protein KUCAC02_014759, partial [Chaenocephalus aceratus]
QHLSTHPHIPLPVPSIMPTIVCPQGLSAAGLKVVHMHREPSVAERQDFFTSIIQYKYHGDP